MSQAVAPLLAEIATAEPPTDVAHLYVSVESWRRAAGKLGAHLVNFLVNLLRA